MTILRITRLTNNQVNKKSHHSQKGREKRKRRPKCCIYCKNCFSIGLCLARLRAITTSEKRDVTKSFGISPSALRQARIRENKGPSLGKVQVQIARQRSMTLKEKFQEETERQERCVRSKAWNLARDVYKLKQKDNSAFYSRAEKCMMPAASTIKPEEIVLWTSIVVVSWKNKH